MQFDGLIDGTDEYLSYGIAASSDLQNQLRKDIDVASRIGFQIIVPEVESQTSTAEFSAADSADSIVFSLLGSRRATLVAEAHCKAHKPLEFSPQ